MSGGGGGVIILKSAAGSPQATSAERQTLYEIADRSVAGCSFADALTAIRIIWKLIRRP